MATPSWLNIDEYPFGSHSFQVPAGQMHYLDEGRGKSIVFVHGNPSWSFQFRNVIRQLSQKYRCIAPDFIGFGLSDKPGLWTYLPRDHAENLNLLLESLDLSDITLVVGDWGGPIGLSYAINHPEKVTNIVITNTWMWPVDQDLHFILFSSFVGGRIGKWLIKWRNFFAQDIVRHAFGDKRRLTKEIHRHYLKPFEKKGDRTGTWVFPREIIGSTEWLRSLWNNVKRLKSKKVLIVWGMKDIAFREKELNTWSLTFPNARIVRYQDAGHFIAEEKPEEFAREIEELIGM
ncbi:alpha/beta fold hydrolase [Methanospirillum lacunae]|uniref:Alpha/beta hydrolase n=2 Tax=Methanospirillum lacunae TaxID=668570 RepID=A0A2V2N2V3_9EURY|nr:alpha/beta fold hydrolase [Methanospirillum lacunae]PWR72875.1 alpha/beta hydrolase [Methanospirillum lacunae]